jgi:hypothetical protein
MGKSFMVQAIRNSKSSPRNCIWPVLSEGFSPQYNRSREFCLRHLQRASPNVHGPSGDDVNCFSWIAYYVDTQVTETALIGQDVSGVKLA